MLKDKRFLTAILVALVVVVVLDLRYFMNRHKQQARPSQPVAAQPREVQPDTVRNVVPVAHRSRPVEIISTDQTRNYPVAHPTSSPAQQVADWHQRFPLSQHARNPFYSDDTEPGPKSEGPSTEERDSGPASHLGAIAVVNGKTLALIDGEPMVADGTIGDVKVVYIGPDGVTLHRGDDRWAEALPPLPEDGVRLVGSP